MEHGNYSKLSMVRLYETAIIYRLPDDTKTKNKLLGLGMVRGTEIMPVQTSPSGDPRAYVFRGSLIAIRNSDADGIIVITNYT